tara:strand:- start:1923 stop:2537 length:615 start_codon:yes stop_codon:yes gene_type:complete
MKITFLKRLKNKYLIALLIIFILLFLFGCCYKYYYSYYNGNIDEVLYEGFQAKGYNIKELSKEQQEAVKKFASATFNIIFKLTNEFNKSDLGKITKSSFEQIKNNSEYEIRIWNEAYKEFYEQGLVAIFGDGLRNAIKSKIRDIIRTEVDTILNEKQYNKGIITDNVSKIIEDQIQKSEKEINVMKDKMKQEEENLRMLRTQLK